jgi:hypothetical protein
MVICSDKTDEAVEVMHGLDSVSVGEWPKVGEKVGKCNVMEVRN